RREGSRPQQGDGQRLLGDDRAAAEAEGPEQARRLRACQHGDGLPPGGADRGGKSRALPGAQEHVGVVTLIRALRLAIALAAALAIAAPAEAGLRVVAATTDLAAIAAAVGGDLVTVETIVPAAVDPEAFEPRPGDIEKIRSAQLLVRVGLGYDYWLDKLVRQAGDKRLMRGGGGYVDASTGIPPRRVSGRSVGHESGPP